jgi:hypothetical protein
MTEQSERARTRRPPIRRAQTNMAQTNRAQTGQVRTDRPQRRGEIGWPMADRSVLATVLGVPTWAAVGLAAGLTALGVCIDLLRIGSLGAVFTVCHVAGCLLAVAWVRRDGLFWPMAIPPLLVAVAVPTVVLLAGAPRPGTGIGEQLLVVGAPMVNAFPVMAWTTGLVLTAGAYRMLTQRLRRVAR